MDSSAPYDERGTLHAEQGSSATRFIGSSSGVHFSNTVISAFAPNLGRSAAGGGGFDHVFLIREEDAGGPDSSSAPSSSSLKENDNATLSRGRMVKMDAHTKSLLVSVSSLPSQQETISHLRRYFKSWHLILPFLDGKQLLTGVKLLYTTGELCNQSTESVKNVSHAMVFSAIIRSVLSLSADLDNSREGDEGQQRSSLSQVVFEDDSIVMSYLPHLMRASRWDSLGAVQAVATLQLFLVSTFRLRTAHQLGGTAIRLAQDAGLHRCPGRFRAFVNDPSMCAMRKRVWHSIISLDRFTSQQLGLPLSVREHDYDVCELGSLELHVVPKMKENSTLPGNASKEGGGGGGESGNAAVMGDAGDHHERPTLDSGDADRSVAARSTEGGDGEEGREGETTYSTSMPRPAYRHRSSTMHSSFDDGRSTSSPSTGLIGSGEAVSFEEQEAQRQSTARSFAHLQSLNARAAEIFNQSVAQRRVSPEMVQKLRGDLDRWWNEMSYDMPSRSSTQRDSSSKQHHHHQQAIFFRISYHSALLNLERPILTRRPGSPTFSAAMQAAIRSSREIINDLSSELFDSVSSSSTTLSLSKIWPGFVRATYLAALVVAYGAQTNEFPRVLAAKDMTRAIEILEALGMRWNCVQSQAAALQVLLNEVQKKEESSPSQTSPLQHHHRQQHNNKKRMAPFFSLDQQSEYQQRSKKAATNRNSSSNGGEMASRIPTTTSTDSNRQQWPPISPSTYDNQHHGGSSGKVLGQGQGQGQGGEGMNGYNMQSYPNLQHRQIHAGNDAMFEVGLQQQNILPPLFASPNNNNNNTSRVNGPGGEGWLMSNAGGSNNNNNNVVDGPALVRNSNTFNGGDAAALVTANMAFDSDLASQRYNEEVGTLQSWEALLAHAEGFLSPLYE